MRASTIQKLYLNELFLVKYFVNKYFLSEYVVFATVFFFVDKAYSMYQWSWGFRVQLGQIKID